MPLEPETLQPGHRWCCSVYRIPAAGPGVRVNAENALKPAARLFVEGDLRDGVGIGLGPGQAHYLRNVLRLGRGATLALFNGRHGEWRARLERVEKAVAEATPLEQLRQQDAGPDVWLCFAPIKRGAIDLLAEKATELGAAALIPMITRRTEVHRVNLDRLRARVVEAAEQCGRLDVPAVAEPRPFDALLDTWPAERTLLACAERGEAVPLYAAAGGTGSPAAVMTGPEGGFAESELDGLRDLPCCRLVGLGPRVLRAETAALAALALWQAAAGDGAVRPPR